MTPAHMALLLSSTASPQPRLKRLRNAATAAPRINAVCLLHTKTSVPWWCRPARAHFPKVQQRSRKHWKTRVKRAEKAAKANAGFITVGAASLFEFVERIKKSHRDEYQAASSRINTGRSGDGNGGLPEAWRYRLPRLLRGMQSVRQSLLTR
jgi:hypothetical protein